MAHHQGFSTILNGTTGAVFYRGSSGKAGNVPTKHYGILGIYHTPKSGNCNPIVSDSPISEGDFNMNNMLLWSQTPKPMDATIDNSFLYGFQFPCNFVGNIS